MDLKALRLRKSLNKGFLKVKPNRTDIDLFKGNLIQLLDRKNGTESEELHKNLVIDFLKKTYYDPNHFINTPSLSTWQRSLDSLIMLVIPHLIKL